MAQQWSRRERLLLAIVVLTAVIVLADIIVLNVVGDLPSGWWPVAVPVGLFLVPVIGVVCMIALIDQRRRTNTTE